jgi:hypothetical protein
VAGDCLYRRFYGTQFSDIHDYKEDICTDLLEQSFAGALNIQITSITLPFLPSEENSENYS